MNKVEELEKELETLRKKVKAYEQDLVMVAKRKKHEEIMHWLLILMELKQCGGDYWNNIKNKTSDCYTFSYKPESKKIRIYNLYSYQEHSLPVYFETKEQVKNAIEKIGEERLKKYWFRAEE